MIVIDDDAVDVRPHVGTEAVRMEIREDLPPDEPLIVNAGIPSTHVSSAVIAALVAIGCVAVSMIILANKYIRRR